MCFLSRHSEISSSPFYPPFTNTTRTIFWVAERIYILKEMHFVVSSAKFRISGAILMTKNGGRIFSPLLTYISHNSSTANFLYLNFNISSLFRSICSVTIVGKSPFSDTFLVENHTQNHTTAINTSTLLLRNFNFPLISESLMKKIT